MTLRELLNGKAPWIALLLTLLGAAIAYGRMSERVDYTRSDLADVRAWLVRVETKLDRVLEQRRQ